MSPSKGNCAETIVGIDPDGIRGRATRLEKGKERKISFRNLKRESPATLAHAPGPSSRQRRGTSSDPEGPYTDSSNHVEMTRRNDVGNKKGEFDCCICDTSCKTKQGLDRHSHRHANDPIVFVCAGKKGKSSPSGLLGERRQSLTH